MIKFLHAADFHLDAAFSSLSPEQGRERRREQREALKELAAASALTGHITDPRTLGDYPEIVMPTEFDSDDSSVVLPASDEEAKELPILRGPNIKPFPVNSPLAESIECDVTLKVGDNITTDHIMPAGTKVLPYRSNVPKLSEFCFTVCDNSMVFYFGINISFISYFQNII